MALLPQLSQQLTYSITFIYLEDQFELMSLILGILSS